MAKDIVINQWQEGVASSPLLGYNMRNVDLDEVPGAVRINGKTEENSAASAMNSYTAQTFTVDTGGDFIILGVAQSMLDGTPVVFTTTTTLPSPLAVDTVYYLNRSSDTTYEVFTTYANAIAGTSEIDITDSGTGTHTVTPTLIDLVKYFVTDGSTTYAGDDNNNVWIVQPTNAWQWIGDVTGGVDGMIVWKGYLLAAQSDNVDAYNTSTGVWTDSIMDAALATGVTHVMHKGADDKIYIANGRFLARISETAGDDFDPTDGASFAAPNNALDLPEDETINSIETLGVDIMLGTDKSNIYRWDRTSATYYNPIEVEAGSVDLMVTLGNLVYIFPSGTATNFSNIYVTNGSSVKDIAEIPKFLIGDGAKTAATPLFYNGASYIKDGRIFFSMGGNASEAIGYAGIWSLTPEGVLNYEHQNSQAALGTDAVNIGACNPLLLSYETDGTNFVDDMSTDRYTGYKAFIESPLVRVGIANEKRAFSQFDTYLSKPLASGEGIRLKVRDDRKATYETVATIDFATYGAIQKLESDYFFEGDNIMVKAELTTGASSTTTPELIEVRVR